MNQLPKLVQTASKPIKQTGQQIAKRIAQEQLETLKSARKQVLQAPESGLNPAENFLDDVPDSLESAHQNQMDQYKAMESQINAQSTQLLAKLEDEIKQIRMKNEQEKQMKLQAEQQEKVVAVQQVQEQKKESRFQKVVSGIKRRISGKREMQKNASG